MKKSVIGYRHGSGVKNGKAWDLYWIYWTEDGSASGTTGDICGEVIVSAERFNPADLYVGAPVQFGYRQNSTFLEFFELG